MTTALSPVQQKALTDFQQFPVWNEARLIPTDALEFCTWNVNEMTDSEFSELVCEVEEGGFDEPLGVIPLDGAPGRYLVPSGEHRARAAIALEMDTVPCVLKVHLTDADLADVKMWSVKRNNIRGRINKDKYFELERSLSERHNVRAEAARQRMLVKGELSKILEKRDKPKVPAKNNGSIVTADDIGDPSGPPLPSEGMMKGDPPAPPAGDKLDIGGDHVGPETDGEREQAKTDRQRSGLERSFKSVWEQVLMDSADTVEHGYLCFAENGKLHLTVNCSDRLIGLVKGLMAQAKNESAAIDDLLCAAISNELHKERS